SARLRRQILGFRVCFWRLPNQQWSIPAVQRHLFSMALSCADFLSFGERVIEQLLEQRTVMNHCRAEIFGGGLAASTTHCDGVSSAIIFNDRRVIDRNDVGALGE